MRKRRSTHDQPMHIFNAWLALSQTWLETGLAAQRVITLRMLRLAKGGAISQREARRMVEEKAHAALAAGRLLATGSDLHKVAKHYRRAVRANEKRLGAR
jgi:hypothetical protein